MFMGIVPFYNNYNFSFFNNMFIWILVKVHVKFAAWLLHFTDVVAPAAICCLLDCASSNVGDRQSLCG